MSDVRRCKKMSDVRRCEKISFICRSIYTSFFLKNPSLRRSREKTFYQKYPRFLFVFINLPKPFRPLRSASLFSEAARSRRTPRPSRTWRRSCSANARITCLGSGAVFSVLAKKKLVLFKVIFYCLNLGLLGIICYFFKAS